jgi:hypothetical protein
MSETDYDIISNMDEWEEGSNACQGGMRRTANPHKIGSKEWAAWNCGYTETKEAIYYDK